MTAATVLVDKTTTNICDAWTLLGINQDIGLQRLRRACINNQRIVGLLVSWLICIVDVSWRKVVSVVGCGDIRRRILHDFSCIGCLIFFYFIEISGLIPIDFQFLVIAIVVVI